MPRELKRFEEVANEIAKKLPNGWNIEIDLEKDFGGVRLFLVGDEMEFPSNRECLQDEVYDALEYAIAEEKRMNEDE